MSKSDTTLRKTTIAAIKRRSKKPFEWNITRFYETERPEDIGPIKMELGLQGDELPVASSISTHTDWTFVTTRRVIGKTDNVKSAININDVEKWTWGDFKGYEDQQKTMITLTTLEGREHKFVIETRNASMVMIYAIRTLLQLSRK
ncbi:hypothetical protein JMN32_08505 [Fulvivirga sp. 29W222]|uniref:Uncharacterized protein n=1 Tax=Fulvivirga marina TaxID=2494733 RepID=A0A937FXP9_9BACT|nr:hypothetical protein [Fulvivirga marina]MBL6446346.1 hypothetical protein [Fulvivirga marina]